MDGIFILFGIFCVAWLVAAVLRGVSADDHPRLGAVRKVAEDTSEGLADLGKEAAHETKAAAAGMVRFARDVQIQVRENRLDGHYRIEVTTPSRATYLAQCEYRGGDNCFYVRSVTLKGTDTRTEGLIPESELGEVRRGVALYLLRQRAAAGLNQEMPRCVQPR